MTSHERMPEKSHDYYLSEDSTSYEPYTTSAPSSESETDSHSTILFSKSRHLRASIATVPECRLREIMVKLVDRCPEFHHAVAKELLSYHTPSSSPLRQKLRRPGRPGSSDTIVLNRRCNKCGNYVKHGKGHGYLRHEKCTFHPGTSIWLAPRAVPSNDPSIVGNLEEEVYEFLSRTPEGHSVNVVRTLTMWSCCDEDEWTPGCATAPAHQIDPEL
jgi:hypothetical protein